MRDERDEIDFIYPRGEIQSPNSITYNIRKQHSATFNDIQQHAGHLSEYFV